MRRRGGGVADRIGRLHGKVVVVTGAGRGLGRAVAEAFAREGANLVLGARTAPEIDLLAANLGDAIAVVTDVRSAEECGRLIEAAVAEFGHIDVLINNAGVAVYGPVGSYGAGEVDSMFDTNVKGLIYCSQAALQAMKPRRSGLIVNVSSIAGKLHLSNESVYCATKWAVNGYTGVLRQEAAALGVRVTVVCPGGIDTPFWSAQEFVPFPDHVDPQRDFLSPDEVAQAILDVALRSERCVVPEIVMLPMIAQPGDPAAR